MFEYFNNRKMKITISIFTYLMIFSRMSDRMMTKYKGEEMTKEEKEKRKLKDAEEAYTKFKEGIQLIERTILQLNATSNETEPICKVSAKHLRQNDDTLWNF